MPTTATTIIVPPISVLAVGRSDSSRNAHTGTSTSSVWAKTVIAAAGMLREATVEDQRAADDEHRPVHQRQPDVGRRWHERVAVGERDRRCRSRSSSLRSRAAPATSRVRAPSARWRRRTRSRRRKRAPPRHRRCCRPKSPTWRSPATMIASPTKRDRDREVGAHEDPLAEEQHGRRRRRTAAWSRRGRRRWPPTSS